MLYSYYINILDNKIKELIYEHGSDNFVKIAELLGTGRSNFQVGERWRNTLNPDINHDPWTTEEGIYFILLFYVIICSSFYFSIKLFL